METMQLYSLFFEPKAMILPYEGNEDFMTDLLSLLDIGLNLACAAAGMNKTEADTDKRLFKGFAAAPCDACEALMSRTLAQRSLGLSEDGREMLRRAAAHIRTRLAISEEERNFVPPFVGLCRSFSLTDFEGFALLVSAGAALDKKYEAVFAALHNHTASVRPTRWLVVRLFSFLFGGAPQEEADFLAGIGTFCRYFFSREEGEGASASVTLFPYVTAYLQGKTLDAVVTEPFEGVSSHRTEEPLLFHEDAFRRISAFFCDSRVGKNGKGKVLHLYGPAGIGKRFLVEKAAGEQGLSVLYADVRMLARLPLGELERKLDALLVKSRLFSAVPCFTDRVMEDEDETEAARQDLQTGEAERRYIRRLAVERMSLSLWLSEERMTALSETEAALLSAELPMLTATERLAAWQYFSGQLVLASHVELPLLANQYILSVGGVRDVLATASLLSRYEGRQEILLQDITEAVRQHSKNQLGQYATMIRPVFTWDDLIIDEAQKARMKMICDRVKYRGVVGEEWGFHQKTPYGRGVCALFYGSPGTGKTMAVQVIARELGLDLYRIDLSQMTSKYIGETQKNISKLFKRAKNINAVLFFDEADSMFAKRTGDVKDANDRYANADTAHLLQKFEEYDGITILATNYVNHIDEAFKRRIKFMVNFVFPAPEVRLRLWKSVLPPGTMLEEEPDFEFFAERFELSGSNIKEIVTGAAYLAAAEGTGLANRHLIRAVKLNFEKYGKNLTMEDFGYLGR